jgi:G3E family GTPase
MPPTGITVVTGFLGAGKTTLVNYVLNADHGYRIAVILNEFGAELGVEKMLVQDKKGGDDDAAVEEWVEMNNGCVCCTVKGSLIQTIDALMERRARRGKKFDFILLETTGLADPGPVAQELWVDDELLEEDGAVLDAVVTLVDASNIVKQLREGKEAALQIAHADVLVLNKRDLVSERDLDAIERTLSAMNAEAKIVRSTRSVVGLEHVLNQGAVTVAGRRGAKPTLGEHAAAATGRGFWAKGVERYMPGNVAASSVHDDGIRTVCLAVEGRIDVRKFETWLESMLWEGGDDDDDDDDGGDGGDDDGGGGGGGEGTKLTVLRAKGVLFAFDDDGATEAKKILQAVREVYEITPGPPCEPGERELNKVVLIGRGLLSREKRLLEGLEKTLV